tara:strand:+ start:1409 stop:2326 length:918 start_codon:yes stop_codon:yes gene_type:complete
MADNKWTKPTNPPPPLFLGRAERNLVKQVNDELLERVIGQQILYMPVSMDYTNFHPIYGEAIEKSFLPPVRVYGLIEFEGITTTTENFGLDKMNHITVKFHERRLHEDQNLYVREGDYVQYGSSFYEIVTLTEERQLFGQIEHLFQIIAKCVRTRKGLIDFEVLGPTIQEAIQQNATLNGALAAAAAPAEAAAAEEEAAGPTPFAAAKIVYGAVDAGSTTPGVLTAPVSAGSSVNDFFGIPEDQEIDINTIMIFLNGQFQLVTSTVGTGDFYLNPESEIISNFELESGEILVVVFLSAITSYFGG